MVNYFEYFEDGNGNHALIWSLSSQLQTKEIELILINIPDAFNW